MGSSSSFPNMTSLMQYAIWESGEKTITNKKECVNTITAKAQSGGRRLVKMGLATMRQEGEFLIFTAVPNGRLDRRVYPTPPNHINGIP